MQETWVPSLGQEDPLKKKMATHSSILAREIPWTEESGGLYSPWSHESVGHDLATNQQQKQHFPKYFQKIQMSKSFFLVYYEIF